MELIFATNNKNKVFEVSALLHGTIKLLTLEDVGFNQEIPEDHETLEENAIQKAETIYKKTGKNCFADDTGLEIEALNGAPGVYSARYAGPNKDANANMDKVLKELHGSANRKALFRTVISLCINGKIHLFEGKVDGVITTGKNGLKGFGYDPIFKPIGKDVTFAALSTQEKNEMSHRGIAVRKLVKFLNDLI